MHNIRIEKLSSDSAYPERLIAFRLQAVIENKGGYTIY